MTMPPRLFLTRRWPRAAEAALASRYRVTFNQTDEPLAPAALIAAMADHDALCPTVSDRLTPDVLAAAGHVRIVANFGAGHDHIDLPAARAAGLTVTNTPDVVTDATADLAIALMLMAARRAGEGERELRGGHWTGWRPTHMMGRDVSGARLGLIGFGRIGQAVARRAHHGFRMHVRYFARQRAAHDVERVAAAEYESDLHALLAESDFVSLHVPGGAGTRHMIDADALSSMRPDAIFINTARGDVVDETALAKALSERRIAAAGLDVYANEPAVPEGLRTLDNVVLLPHLGSATEATRTAMGMRVLANLDAFFAGSEPPDRIA